MLYSGSFNPEIASPVRIRIPIFIYVCNSSANSFVAYGISTISVVTRLRVGVGRSSMFCPVVPMKRTGPSHSGHTNKFWRLLKIGTVPHPLHSRISAKSALSIRLSRKNRDMPCPASASRSISPIRRPPCAPRPPVGCRVLCSLRPSARAFHLSSTMCFKRMANTGPLKIVVGICTPDAPSYMI